MTTLYLLRNPDEEEEEFEDKGSREDTLEYAAEQWGIPVAGVRVMSTRQVHDYDEWEVQFRPIKNSLRDDAPYDGRMFETFGEEEDYVKRQDPRLIWTVLDCDGLLWLSPGWHFVNRFGYFVTQKPFEKIDEEGEGYLA